MTAQALLPVGKDCDCGHPLVWRHGQQWCAVWGSHPAPVHYRFPDAPGAALIQLCMAEPSMSRSAIRHRAIRAAKRAA
jgi:hypothetical protein